MWSLANTFGTGSPGKLCAEPQQQRALPLADARLPGLPSPWALRHLIRDTLGFKNSSLKDGPLSDGRVVLTGISPRNWRARWRNIPRIFSGVRGRRSRWPCESREGPWFPQAGSPHHEWVVEVQLHLLRTACKRGRRAALARPGEITPSSSPQHGRRGGAVPTFTVTFIAEGSRRLVPNLSLTVNYLGALPLCPLLWRLFLTLSSDLYPAALPTEKNKGSA